MSSMTDRLIMDPPESYHDMEEQLMDDDQEQREQVKSENVVANGEHRKDVNEDEEDYEDLELSLQALERLDRSSPDLWPDHIPGVGQFLPPTPYHDSDTPRGSDNGASTGYLHNLSREE